MSDISISYAREDRETAQRLAEALEAKGWSVWWDTRLKAGEVWDEVIGRELAAARCVIVLWSKISIQRNWVRVEAEEGLRRRILVPVRIGNVEPPLAFRLIHAGDLIDWKGRREHPGFQRLMADVVGIIGPPPQKPSATPPSDGPEPKPAPSSPNNGTTKRKTTDLLKNAWPQWLGQSVATIKRYIGIIVGWRPRKWHMAMTGGITLLVFVGVVYFLDESSQPMVDPPSVEEDPQPRPGPQEPLPQTFETNIHGIIGEVTDFSMAGESARLSIRLFSNDENRKMLCITPAAATLVDERTGKEWKASSYSHSSDCENYYPKISQMYWMSFHIGQDLQTTFTLLIPGLARPVKGLELR